MGKQKGNLERLRKLDVRCNYIVRIPESICTLPLTCLLARSNCLTHLPENFGELKQLSDCRLEDNKLEFLPDSIGELDNLKLLFIFNNKLIEINPNIGKLTSLIEMDASSNHLTRLPDPFGNLINLSALFLADNLFQFLPSALGIFLLSFSISFSSSPLPSFSFFISPFFPPFPSFHSSLFPFLLIHFLSVPLFFQLLFFFFT